MKRKIRIGQLVGGVGTLLLGVGLLLNGFEVIPVTAFRVIVALGVLIEIIALILIIKRSEF